MHRAGLLRGEYKVPGGKLVAVDVDGGGRPADARCSVSGDFFLEPDSALEDDGRRADRYAGRRRTPTSSPRAISSALDDAAALIGFSPQAVGIAVRRALGQGHRLGATTRST